MAFVLHDYVCDDCGRIFEELTSRADNVSELPCPSCGGTASRAISAVAVYSPRGWVTPSSSTLDDSNRPPGALDTRPLAEGMSMAEWRAQRTLKRERRIHDWVKTVT